jgi:hypothetical protein
MLAMDHSHAFKEGLCVVMRAWFKKPVKVRGYVVPSRRYTIWALVYCLLYFALPVLAIGAVLDVMGYLITVKLLGGGCYGLLCLF